MPQFTNPATPSTTHRVQTGDLTIALSRFEGNGPEALLIHGIGSSQREFFPVIDELSTFVRPITVDLRGHGASDKPGTGYHYSDYVNDLDSLLPAIGMDRDPLILGHSLGGIITLFWAAQHPGKPGAIIFEDSPLRSREEFRPAFESWLAINAMSFEEARAHYATEFPHWPEALANDRARGITTTQRAVFMELMERSMAGEGLDASVDIGDITCPVLFLHGDVETGSMVHPEDIAGLPARMPNVQVVRVPGGSHSIHRNKREEFIAAVRQFIAAQS